MKLFASAVLAGLLPAGVLAQGSDFGIQLYASCGGILHLQTSAGTGPRFFRLQYTANLGGNWVDTGGFIFGTEFLEPIVASKRFFRLRDLETGADSSNVVGYLNVVVPPGASLLSQSFGTSDPALGTLLPDVPNGLTLFKAGTNGYIANNFLFGWSDPKMSLRPGEAFWLLNPHADTFVVTFQGEALQGTLTNRLPAGTSLCGSIVPRSGRLATDLGFPAGDQDVVAIWDNASATYAISFYDGFSGTWFPMEPVLQSGEAFLATKAVSADWRQDLSLTSGGGAYFIGQIPATSQVAQVNFFTFNTNGSLGRVYDTDGVTPISGAFFGQLYAGTSPDEAGLTAVGAPVPFLSGAGAGYVNSGTVSIPGAAAGQTVYLQLRVWPAARGSAYESVLMDGGKLGKSSIIPVVVASVTSQPVPPTANGFPSFQLQTPAISVQPQSQAVALGAGALLSIDPAGAAPFTFQWQLSGTNLPGQTNASLLIGNAQSADAGRYCVVVSDSLRVTNVYCATIKVLAPPLITSQPGGQTVAPGGNFVLTMAASGDGPLTYQWRLNGANIPDQTNTTLVITNIQRQRAAAGVQPADSGNYSVIAANPVGAANSTVAALIVQTPLLPLADDFSNRVATNSISGTGSSATTNFSRELGEPNHAGKPGGRSAWLAWTAPANGVASFSTAGSDFDTLVGVYTGASLTNQVEAASDDDGGGFFTSTVFFQAQAGTNYNIAIDGFGGAAGRVVLSWNLDTNVTQIPRIVSQPASLTVSAGGDATFTVFAANASKFQWLFNGCTVIPGATSASLTITNVQQAAVGAYRVEVTSDSAQTLQSLPAYLEIGADPKGQSQDKFEDLFGSAGAHSALARARASSASASLGAGGFVSVSVGTINSQILNDIGATTQQGESNHCGVIGGSSKWFGLEADGDGVMVIDTIGSSIDTVLAVYTGTDLLGLALVTCDHGGAPDGIGSQVRFNARAATSYAVAVDGVHGAQGTINLNWKLGLPPVVAATPTNPTVFAGAPLRLHVVATSLTPDLKYQWRLNGANIRGATTETLMLSDLQPDEAGTYSVMVSNFAGAVTADIAQVVVALPIQVRVQWLPISGSFYSVLTGPLSQGYVVQGSSNLSSWRPLYTNSAPAALLNFVDPQSPNRTTWFYRVMPWP